MDILCQAPQAFLSSRRMKNKAIPQKPHSIPPFLPSRERRHSFRSRPPRALGLRPSYFAQVPHRIMSHRKRVRSDFFESWGREEQSEFARGLLSIEQRFPGPAGLMPRLSNPRVVADPDSALSGAVDSIVGANNQSASYCPDRSILALPKEPWKALLRELELDPNSGLLTLATIEWVEKCYPRLREKDKNIPFLAAVIEGDPVRGRFQEPLMTVKVMDASGSILLSLDPEIVKAYAADLKKGTAMAMCNVQVLRASNTTKMIVLPISRLVCIASYDENLGSVIRRRDDVSFDKCAAEAAFLDLNMMLETGP